MFHIKGTYLKKLKTKATLNILSNTVFGLKYKGHASAQKCRSDTMATKKTGLKQRLQFS